MRPRCLGKVAGTPGGCRGASLIWAVARWVWDRALTPCARRGAALGASEASEGETPLSRGQWTEGKTQLLRLAQILP